MITEEEVQQGLNKAYKELGHNAYFGNGFKAGVRFAEQKLKNSRDQVELLIDFLLYLNNKGLINNHDFEYEKEAKLFKTK